MDHTQAPILESVKSYHEAGMVPFTTPGHKCGRAVPPETSDILGKDGFYNDIAVLGGLDDRTMSKDIEGKAQELAADAYGADSTHFAVNGSSQSVQAVMLTVAGPGDEVLVTRNAHKSLISGLILSGARPVYIYPEHDDERNIAHGVTPAHLRRAIDEHPRAKAVFVVSPTYYGVASDTKTLAEISHERDIPFIVDEAWGPHLPFHPDLPLSAMHSGADVSVCSIHKMLTGFSQASIINVKGKRVSDERIAQCRDLLESTSESSLILSSIDGCRRQMMLHGRKLLDRTLKLSDRARKTINSIEGLAAMGEEVLSHPGAVALDRTKLVIDVHGLGLSGFKAADWLYSEKHVPIELADHRHLMALLTIGDDDESIDRLLDAMRGLAEWAHKKRRDETVELPPLKELKAECVLTPRDAYFSPSRRVPFDQAAGEIATEMLSPYPPGIPIIFPGERMTEPILEYLRVGMKAGMYVLDATDPSVKTLRVAA